ncbi:MAG: hypothetical protein MO852_13330 [Candidatus Devosia euplotis]|nr:hypothetical protein [Candidatus Devosia euplotis]
MITFQLPALRFIYCMYPDDARLWFGETGQYLQSAFRRTAHLPEPGLSYRIATQTSFTALDGGAQEALARAAEIEILPNPPGEEASQQLYLLQQSGNRFTSTLMAPPELPTI